jgi:hypothetical protein
MGKVEYTYGMIFSLKTYRVTVAATVCYLLFVICNLATAQGTSLENPLKFGTITEFVKAILGAIMYLGLPIIALVVIMAGLQFILARGNSGKIEEAKQNLMFVVIGMGIFLGAWALTGIVANTISLFRSSL